MTRKDYELIARSIRESIKDTHDFGFNSRELVAANEATKHVAQNLMLALAQDNPRFNSHRFLEACGITEDNQ